MQVLVELGVQTKNGGHYRKLVLLHRHVAFEDDGGSTTSPGKTSKMVGLLPVTPAPAPMEESSPESSKGAKSPIMSLRKASLALPSNRVGQVGRDVLLALGAMKIKDFDNN